MIKCYWAHFRYTVKHRWYVFLECVKLGVPLRGLLHDLSKFRMREFIPYATFFFDKNGEKKDFRNTGYLNSSDEEFKMAWFWHIRSNKHHWQYWVIVNDAGEPYPMEMPWKYVWEMIADWRGAARAKNDGSALLWYEKQKDTMILHPDTRKMVELILGYSN